MTQLARRRSRPPATCGGSHPGLTETGDRGSPFWQRMAAQGVPMRASQEMMGHRDFTTTLIYTDYAPSAREAEWVEAAFATDSREALAT